MLPEAIALQRDMGKRGADRPGDADPRPLSRGSEGPIAATHPQGRRQLARQGPFLILQARQPFRVVPLLRLGDIRADVVQPLAVCGLGLRIEDRSAVARLSDDADPIRSRQRAAGRRSQARQLEGT